MQAIPRRTALALILFGLSGCGRSRRKNRPAAKSRNVPLYPNETPALRALIEKYAAIYDVPVALVQKVIIRESTHRPRARNGPYYGLMQILPQTARTMGYRGSPNGLLDAETNLKYAVKYLRGAWLLSYGDYDKAVSWYARGYYYEAKRRGMLVETGLRPKA
jgi:soluble lytic murein transglycosylase-like protein